jgi:hypothetical protein
MSLNIDLKQVESSNLRRVGYSAKAKVLEVEFLKQDELGHHRKYRYYQVPKTVHMNMMQAKSLGKFMHAHIFGKYTFEEMK